MNTRALLAALLLLCSAATAQTPWTPIAVSTDPTPARITVATEGNLTALFVQRFDGIYVSASDATAQVWTTPFRIDNTPAGGFTLLNDTLEHVHVLNGSIHVGWVSYDGVGEFSINYRRSDDGGLTWSTLIQIPSGTTNSGTFSMEVSTGSGGDNVFILWSAGNSAVTTSGLYLSVNDLSAPGVAFLPPAHVPSWTAGGSVGVLGADLDANGDTVDVVSADNRSGFTELWHSASTNRGQSFGTEKRLDLAGVSLLSERVLVQRQGNTVAAAWTPDGGGSSLATAVSTDGGATFGSEQLVTSALTFASAPTMEIDPTNPNTIVYAYFTGGIFGSSVFTTTTFDAASSFEPEVTHTSSAANIGPNLAVGSDGVFSIGWTVGSDVYVSYASTGSNWVPVNVASGASPTRTSSAHNSLTSDVICGWIDGNTTFASGFALGATGVTNRTQAPNPQSYVASAAILGTLWTATVDLSTTGHNFAQVIMRSAPASMQLQQGDVLLITGQTYFSTPIMMGPNASFSMPVPADPALCGFTGYSQAIHFGGVKPFRLSNAQDVTVGT